jgi:hypothetical protein
VGQRFDRLVLDRVLGLLANGLLANGLLANGLLANGLPANGLLANLHRSALSFVISIERSR